MSKETELKPCEEISIIALLKSYSVYKNFLHSHAYAKEFFDTDDGIQADEKAEQYEAKMHVIELLIQLLEPSNEYTLLRLHYIEGVPIEKCAESMRVSRRTVFRMLKKAHKTICDLVSEHKRIRADVLDEYGKGGAG